MIRATSKPLAALVAGALALLGLMLGCAGQARANPPAAPAARTSAGITGQWMIEPGDRPGMLRLTLQRHVGSHHHMSSNDDVSVSQVRGLDWKQAQTSAGAAFRFQIQRDAGAFACEGWFRDGRGSGHFTFTRSDAFVADMRALGYPGLSSEQVFSLAVHDVTRSYVRELAAVGYQKLSYERLIAMHIHGVSARYVRELAALGLRNLDSEQLVAMRIHGVSPEGIRALAQLGYRNLDSEQLVAMRIHGVSPELVRELRAEGYRAVPAEKLVAMRIHGVSPDFIRRLRKRGYDKLSVDELISLKIHGVAR